MGAGLQRWWRDYHAETEAWSNRDVVRTYEAPSTIVTEYKNGSVVVVNKGAARIVELSSPIVPLDT